jgi:HSP20 family protein
MSYLMRQDPWRVVNQLQRDLDRVFGAPVLQGDDAAAAVVNWAPAVDIREEPKQFVLHADLPGVKPEDIEVSLEKGILTVRGQRRLENREEKDGYRRVERVGGEFFRRFSLPDTADSQSVKAKFNNGVLEVVIPKQQEVLPRRINVEQG